MDTCLSWDANQRQLCERQVGHTGYSSLSSPASSAGKGEQENKDE